jgi:ferredoxin-NADP reductase/MOSC domain-containing protein YiiM/ferredoxin
MARLLSVNVGLPRDIAWKGRTVHTGIWKLPVQGRCRARRLNLDGDGQGDLAGHGGEHRAVYVYQIESYRYWQERLSRTDFTYGQFGENFTIEGMADLEVCIGDRYRIGTALFEVTQPRVTCYRVGIRMNEPRMPAFLTSSGRPGFYFRVLEEGEVSAGDEIAKVGEVNERMSVAEINALLYSGDHSQDRLERALRIEALSPGWRGSFDALLQSAIKGAATGNAGLAPAAASNPVSPGFRPLKVTAIEEVSADVLSLTFSSTDGQPLQTALPGQYIVLRLQPVVGGSALFRSYSLSGALSTETYRISVKIEPHGAAGQYLRQQVRTGDVLDVSAPRGSFVLKPGDGPVVLLSAGIGATPVLAMLHSLSAARSTREVLWMHTARDGRHHPFAAETRRLMLALSRGRRHICYSAPESSDLPGENFDATGRLSQTMLDEAGVLSREADVYLCGPTRFMADMKEALANLGVAPHHVHAEVFSGGESSNPGIVEKSTRAPHPPKDEVSTGALVSFSRSGIATRWNASVYGSILELAEACDVPVRWACRAGVCHRCESGLIAGSIAYQPDPLDSPAKGNVLICCAAPQGDVVIDI